MTGRMMLEHEWKAWLAARGVLVPRGVFLSPEQVARGLPEAVRALQPPLAAKALAPTIVHKTEVGAVRLAIGAREDLAAVLLEMGERLERQGLGPISGFLVEEMAEPGVELVLGTLTDPAFGRLLAFGLGGVGIEALGEVCFFALPLRPFDVDAVVRTVPWLERALARASASSLSELHALIWRFGGLEGLALSPEIDRLEINPLIVNRVGAVAVDARGARRAC